MKTRKEIIIFMLFLTKHTSIRDPWILVHLYQKRNFLHVRFSDKLKPLRIGPFKYINKISDITYEIVNQGGYTSHIHRNHLVPYYPKEPILFPFLQQSNPHLFNDNYSNINNQIIDSDENQFSDEHQFSSTKFNKETDIPSTMDFQPESFSQYSSFPYQEKEQDSKNTNSDNQSDIHDYDYFINPRRHSYNRYNFRPQSRKDNRLLLGEKDIISLSQKSS